MRLASGSNGGTQLGRRNRVSCKVQLHAMMSDRSPLDVQLVWVPEPIHRHLDLSTVGSINIQGDHGGFCGPYIFEEDVLSTGFDAMAVAYTRVSDSSSQSK
jgi:hypothetical protein